MKRYIGIDPGSKGYLVLLEEDRIIDSISIADHTMYEIADWLNDVQFDTETVGTALEEVHSVFGSSAKATFAFGQIFGMLQGLLIAYKIPFTLVPPKKWQAEIWTASDKVMTAGKVDTKKTSLNAGHRLYPTFSFKRTEKCKNDDDNLCDAVLIATYARRKNL